jgi:heme exporter protein A
MESTVISEDRLIQATQLAKAFGIRHVLKGLDLSAHAGEIVALLGVNGAGKTTLLRVLATLTIPDSGSIRVNGISTKSEPNLVRQKLGVVLHSPMLYGNLTAEENLAFFARLYGVQNPRERISGLLNLVGLSKRKGDLVRTFSKGMQQKLSITRALLHDPDYLLMDEPYSSLDQSAIQLLDQILLGLARQGKTVLIATHDIERIFPIANRFDILHKGRIAASFSSDGLSCTDLAKKFQLITNSPAEANAL